MLYWFFKNPFSDVIVSQMVLLFVLFWKVYFTLNLCYLRIRICWVASIVKCHPGGRISQWQPGGRSGSSQSQAVRKYVNLPISPVNIGNLFACWAFWPEYPLVQEFQEVCSTCLAQNVLCLSINWHELLLYMRGSSQSASSHSLVTG